MISVMTAGRLLRPFVTGKWRRIWDFGERFLECLTRRIAGTMRHITLVAPDTDRLRHSQRDQLRQRNALAFGLGSRLLQHRFGELGFDGRHKFAVFSSLR